MILEIVHPNGQRYRIPSSQVIVRGDSGEPVAVAWQTGQLIVHSTASARDWLEVLHDLGVEGGIQAEDVRL